MPEKGDDYNSKYLPCKIKKKVVMNMIYAVEDILSLMCLKNQII